MPSTTGALASISRSWSSTTSAGLRMIQKRQDDSDDAEADQGIGLVSFLTALVVAFVIFLVQMGFFLLLRNKLARIFKPKTYLVPERERTDPPARSFGRLMKDLMLYSDREVIRKCGLDAYFFLRYLKTLLVIFVPICCVVMPILIPLNYVGGLGQNIEGGGNNNVPTGLDTLAWGNVSPANTDRYTAHLILAILVCIWVCTVVFIEMRVYIKVRQDYLTSAEHRLRASATTVLVNAIPDKWLSEEALKGLFDVFPGGVRNVWINRNLKPLLAKVKSRIKVHKKLEKAETALIKDAKKAQLKQKKKEDKQQRKELKLDRLSKDEKAARDAKADQDAKRRAQDNEGVHAGDTGEVPHTVTAGVREFEIEHQDHGGHDNDSSSSSSDEEEHDKAGKKPKGLKIPIFGDPLSKVSHGIKGTIGKVGGEMDETLETTNGFVGLGPSTAQARQSTSRESEHKSGEHHSRVSNEVPPLSATETLDQVNSPMTADSTRAFTKPQHRPTNPPLNTVRKLENIDDLMDKDNPRFWEFWKPPAGGYASPVPQGPDAEDYLSGKGDEKKSFWQKMKGIIPFMGEEDKPFEYERAFNEDYKEDDEEKPVWEKYLKKGKRPTHHLPLFGVSFLPGIPFINEKVDTIDWCREELARLNVEIEEDQQHPERYPLMTSAFIQFNHQIASHMACQSLLHHIPRQMSPRHNEISPRDIVWGNMAISWWAEWLRTSIAVGIVGGMIFVWAVPVAWTAALGQLDELIKENSWLSFLTVNPAVEKIATAIAGVLPAALLALLLFLIPVILRLLAEFKGAKTGAQKEEFVQLFYFIFLFIQVFLVVSIASFFAASFDELINNLSELKSVEDVLDLLAENLPKAANYFFSYMILQAMSVSSGTLLQIGTLITWFVLAKILDSTARAKWTRNTKLNHVSWGSFFPVYTNFACIGLIYCIIAPLISIFAIITFSLLYMAQRYAMVYVTRFEMDTGGVLYPRALNQTFTGLYVMQLCLAGLFFIAQDENGNLTCTTHGIIMFVVLGLTVIYQLLLNFSFSPLFRYLPITVEDEAVLRDEAFQRAQDRRLGLINDSDDDSERNSTDKPRDANGDIEMTQVSNGHTFNFRNPVKQVGDWAVGGSKQVGTWAKGGGKQIGSLAKGGEAQLRKIANLQDSTQAAEYRRKQREKDIEAQRAIGEALFGGIHDEIEDLTPEERDALVRHAFRHSALRARRPTVWLPRDDLGISDDEVRRTQAYSEHIWISNEGTALDSKVRVVYGKNPPDFTEVDLINL